MENGPESKLQELAMMPMVLRRTIPPKLSSMSTQREQLDFTLDNHLTRLLPLSLDLLLRLKQIHLMSCLHPHLQVAIKSLAQISMAMNSRQETLDLVHG